MGDQSLLSLTIWNVNHLASVLIQMAKAMILQKLGKQIRTLLGKSFVAAVRISTKLHTQQSNHAAKIGQCRERGDLSQDKTSLTEDEFSIIHNRGEACAPNPWTPHISIPCSDGMRRGPVEPTLYPLADGIPGRMGIVRGAGNAIVPQVAASFIRAAMEVIA
jgi:hypothetical protein